MHCNLQSFYTRANQSHKSMHRCLKLVCTFKNLWSPCCLIKYRKNLFSKQKLLWWESWQCQKLFLYHMVKETYSCDPNWKKVTGESDLIQYLLAYVLEISLQQKRIIKRVCKLTGKTLPNCKICHKLCIERCCVAAASCPMLFEKAHDWSVFKRISHIRITLGSTQCPR